MLTPSVPPLPLPSLSRQPASCPARTAQPAPPQDINPVMPNPIFTQSFSTGVDTQPAASRHPAEEEDDGDYFDDLLSILNKRS